MHNRMREINENCINNLHTHWITESCHGVMNNNVFAVAVVVAVVVEKVKWEKWGND
jgi:hypothetical protein